MRDSGLRVNEAKTEVCLFYKNNHPLIELEFNNVKVKSKTSMNILGVQFDSRLQWTEHISNTINKSKRALHAIKLIKKHFNKEELRQLLTANYYSILYYNAEVWQVS